LQLNKDKYGDAAKDLERALGINQDNESARLNLAKAYVEKKDFAKAREFLNLDKFTHPDIQAQAALLKAVILREQVENDQNIINTVKVDDIQDVETLNQVNSYKDTLESLNKIPEDELSDKYRDVILAKGALDVEIEDVAIDLLEKYVELQGEYWEIYFYLGEAYYLDGDLEKAQGFLDNSMSLNPGSYLGPWILARVYLKNDNLDKMEENYLRSIELADADPRINIRKEFAEILADTQKYASADEQYDFLIEEDAENSNDYKLCKAQIALDRGIYDNLEETLSQIDKSKLADANLAQYYYLKAALSLEKDKFDEALSWIKDAIELDNKSATYYLHYGQILFEDDQAEKSKEYFQKAIDFDLSGDVSPKAVKFLDRI
jgi:tetratricopeptide (TPR) repeat protein